MLVERVGATADGSERERGERRPAHGNIRFVPATPGAGDGPVPGGRSIGRRGASDHLATGLLLGAKSHPSLLLRHRAHGVVRGAGARVALVPAGQRGARVFLHPAPLFPEPGRRQAAAGHHFRAAGPIRQLVQQSAETHRGVAPPRARRARAAGGTAHGRPPPDQREAAVGGRRAQAGGGKIGAQRGVPG